MEGRRGDWGERAEKRGEMRGEEARRGEDELRDFSEWVGPEMDS